MDGNRRNLSRHCIASKFISSTPQLVVLHRLPSLPFRPWTRTCPCNPTCSLLTLPRCRAWGWQTHGCSRGRPTARQRTQHPAPGQPTTLASYRERAAEAASAQTEPQNKPGPRRPTNPAAGAESGVWSSSSPCPGACVFRRHHHQRPAPLCSQNTKKRNHPNDGCDASHQPKQVPPHWV